MPKNKPISLIITFIEALKTKEGYITGPNGECIGAIKYLLNQTLRNYWIPKEHFLISEAANNLWKTIQSKDMWNVFYKECVTVESEEPVYLDIYKGASNQFIRRPFSNGEKFCYKDVFHDDHIVPIDQIIDELVALETVDDESVKRIIAKIYVCKMLKKEDRELHNKTKRPSNVSDVINGIYSNNGIRVLGWTYPGK